jgi:hypothetical protein
MSEEIKPDDVNPKDLIGVTKCPLRFVPPALSIFVAPAMADGARKYTWFNWRAKKVRYSIYIEAIERHLLALKDGEDLAADSQVHHAAHIGACVAILADAMAHGSLIDDRPPKGPASAMMAAQVKGDPNGPKDPYSPPFPRTGGQSAEPKYRDYDPNPGSAGG